MQFLSYNDLLTMVARAPPAPTLEPTSASVGPYECPICFQCKPGATVLHSQCLRVICAKDAMDLIDLNPILRKCPWCRGALREDDWNATSRINIIKPTPNDVHWLEQVKYQCQGCNAEMAYKEACEHPTRCDHLPQPRRPPDHINPWRAGPTIQRYEVVSNPSSETGPTPGTKSERPRDRLIIHHYNGRQFVSKFHRQAETIYSVKTRLADMTGAYASDIKIYKFVHRELPDDARVGEVTSKFGSTYLASLTTPVPDLSNRTAMVVFEEAGPPLLIPPPNPTQP